MAVARVVPAHQRLEAADLAAGQLAHRLVGHGEAAFVDGAAQVAFKPQAVGHLGVQAGVEHRVARLARALGFVHRRVGVAQHVFGAGVAQGAEGDADAGTRHQLGASHVEGLAHGLHQALGQGHRKAFVFQLADEHAELVAAQAGHDVMRTQAFADAVRDLHEELISGVMPQAVVDELEAVEVEEHHRVGRVGVGLRRVNRLRQVFVEAAPVGQAGQAVVEGDVVQAFFGLAPRGDVLHLQDQAWRAGAGLGEEAAMRRHPHRLATAVEAAQLQGEAFEFMAADEAQLLVEHQPVFVQHHVLKALLHQLFAAAANERAQGRVGLQDVAFEAEQGHADGRMREGAVEAAFAGLQLAHMARGEFAFALAGLGARQAHRLGRFLLAEEVVQRGQHHRQERHHGHQHADARLAVGQEQQRRHRRTAGVGDADPAEHAEEVGPLQALVALQARHRRDEQGVKHEVAQGESH